MQFQHVYGVDPVWLTDATGVLSGCRLLLPYLYDKLQGACVRQVVRPAAVHDVQRLHLNAVPRGGRGIRARGFRRLSVRLGAAYKQ